MIACQESQHLGYKADFLFLHVPAKYQYPRVASKHAHARAGPTAHFDHSSQRTMADQAKIQYAIPESKL